MDEVDIILNHELVPKHEILTDDQKNDLLKKLDIDVKQLPKISFNDRIVTILNAKPMDVIKITRKSPTTGETTYYRVVVNV